MKAFVISIFMCICFEGVYAQLISLPVGKDSILHRIDSSIWTKNYCNPSPGEWEATYYFLGAVDTQTNHFFVTDFYNVHCKGDSLGLFQTHGSGNALKLFYKLDQSSVKVSFNCQSPNIGFFEDFTLPLMVQTYYDDALRMSFVDLRSSIAYSHGSYPEYWTYYHYDSVISLDYSKIEGQYGSKEIRFEIFNNKIDMIKLTDFQLVVDTTSELTFEIVNDSSIVEKVEIVGRSKKVIMFRFKSPIPPQKNGCRFEGKLLCHIDIGGRDSVYQHPLTFDFSSAQIAEVERATTKKHLIQVYPNPSSQNAKVVTYSPEQRHCYLSIFDELGREVRRVHDGFLDVGEHEFSAELPTGMYYVRMQVGDEVLTRKVTVVK